MQKHTGRFDGERGCHFQVVYHSGGRESVERLEGANQSLKEMIVYQKADTVIWSCLPEDWDMVSSFILDFTVLVVSLQPVLPR